MGSILGETKQQLGLAADAVGFDPELILFINAVLSDLTQIGVGPERGFTISDDTETWESFLGSDVRLNSAKTYLFISVKLLFDPPQVGYVLTSMERLRDEAAWRLSVKADESATVLAGAKLRIAANVGDEQVIRLANPTDQTIINSQGSYSAEFTGIDGCTVAATLDTSQLADGVLLLPIVVQTGVYVVRLLSPRRTILTIEVEAR